jgi:hypothetical protein
LPDKSYFKREQERSSSVDLPPDLEKRGIEYHPGNYCPFSYEIASQFNSFELVTLKVSLGWFTLSMNILNTEASSPCSKLPRAAWGSFGSIYHILPLGREVAVKSYVLNRDDEHSSKEAQVRLKISEAIKEYCISKISYALGCGPQIGEELIGFDMIVFRNRIEFGMENCTVVSEL